MCSSYKVDQVSSEEWKLSPGKVKEHGASERVTTTALARGVALLGSAVKVPGLPSAP